MNFDIIIFGLIGLPLHYSNVGLLLFETKNNLNQIFSQLEPFSTQTFS